MKKLSLTFRLDWRQRMTEETKLAAITSLWTNERTVDLETTRTVLMRDTPRAVEPIASIARGPFPFCLKGEYGRDLQGVVAHS